MFLFIISVVILFGFLLGPRANVRLGRYQLVLDTKLNTQERNQPDLLALLADQVATQERQYPSLISGTEKLVQFHNPEKPTKTEHVVLYLHGFSACRQEISPVAENIAAQLQANFFATRLTGHGMNAEQLAQATADDWLQDAIEAWQLATQLGQKVVIIATSTGASLATWLAQQHSVAEQSHSLILVSPNFRPNHWAMNVFLWPWAKFWLPLLVGRKKGRAPQDKIAARYWTAPYPTSSLCHVAALAKAACQSDVASIQTPTLFIYCDDDKTVDSRVTDQVIKRWGSKRIRCLSEQAVEGTTNHVIVGDLARPESNHRITEEILRFIHG
ncbi:alpha/beta hydrolase [Reinekea thalattae]|uniref:alpha/beta hydrolase n=1 Tax=Reinekea thalattae TaxID=2593301 RepID=UPI00165058C3|nr:alpha/beta fold hydrolase [Reinekea thalattae]